MGLSRVDTVSPRLHCVTGTSKIGTSQAALVSLSIMHNAFFKTTYASCVRMYYQKVYLLAFIPLFLPLAIVKMHQRLVK